MARVSRASEPGESRIDRVSPAYGQGESGARARRVTVDRGESRIRPRGFRDRAGGCPESRVPAGGFRVRPGGVAHCSPASRGLRVREARSRCMRVGVWMHGSSARSRVVLWGCAWRTAGQSRTARQRGGHDAGVLLAAPFRVVHGLSSTPARSPRRSCASRNDLDARESKGAGWRKGTTVGPARVSRLDARVARWAGRRVSPARCAARQRCSPMTAGNRQLSPRWRGAGPGAGTRSPRQAWSRASRAAPIFPASPPNVAGTTGGTPRAVGA